MLLKLLKYDLLHGKNGFFGLAAALLSVALVFRFTTDFFSNAIIPFVGSLLILSVINIVVSIMTIVFIYQGFSKTFFGDHGYLMFTLPVKHSMLLKTKVITSLIWLNFMAIVSVVSGGILTFDHGGQVYFDQSYVIAIFTIVHYNVIGFLALSILFLIITLSTAAIRGRSIHFVFSAIIGAFYFAAWVQTATLFFNHVANFGAWGIGHGTMINLFDTPMDGHLVYYDFFLLGSATVFGMGACLIILKLFKYMELK